MVPVLIPLPNTPLRGVSFRDGSGGANAIERGGLSVPEAAASTCDVRVVTFDLDNTLWRTGPCIKAANDALADYLASQNIVQPARVEVVMGELFRSNKQLYSPLDGDAKSPVLLTELRIDAISHILENHNGNEPKAAVDGFAQRAFDVWTDARHGAVR